jgi:hypothetical protein
VRRLFAHDICEEISIYKLDILVLGVQEVRWDRDVSEPAGEFTYFYGMGDENLELPAFLCKSKSK